MTTNPDAVALGTLTAERPIFHTPVRTHDQRMAALKHANDVRVKRAQLKRDVAAGRKTVAGILRDPGEHGATTMKVYDLLMAVPKIGDVKAKRIMVMLLISSSKKVGGLSPRQRDELVNYFERGANG